MEKKNNHNLTFSKYEKLDDEASSLESFARYFQSEIEDHCHPEGSEGAEVDQSSQRLYKLVIATNLSKSNKKQLLGRINAIDKARQEVYLQSEKVKELSENLYEHIREFDPDN